MVLRVGIAVCVFQILRFAICDFDCIGRDFEVQRKKKRMREKGTDQKETASGHRTAPSTTTASTDAGASAGAAAGDDDACDGGSFIVNRECEMSACCGGEIESTEDDRLNRE